MSKKGLSFFAIFVMIHLSVVFASERPELRYLLKLSADKFKYQDGISVIYSDSRFRSIISRPKKFLPQINTAIESGHLSELEFYSLVVMVQRLRDDDYLFFLKRVFEAEAQGRLPIGSSFISAVPPEEFAELAIRRHLKTNYKNFYRDQSSKAARSAPHYDWLQSGTCIYDAETWFKYTAQKRVCNGRIENAP
jgi:hypothetical protein